MYDIKEKKYKMPFGIVEILFFIYGIIIIFLSIEKNIPLSITVILLLFLGITIFALVRAKNRIIKKERLKYEKLQKNGILIKDLECRCETRVFEENKPYEIVVDYKKNDGAIMKFRRGLKNNEEKLKDLKTIDLLLDPDDFSNYILEPSINKLKE